MCTVTMWGLRRNLIILNLPRIARLFRALFLYSPGGSRQATKPRTDSVDSSSSENRDRAAGSGRCVFCAGREAVALNRT